MNRAPRKLQLSANDDFNIVDKHATIILRSS